MMLEALIYALFGFASGAVFFTGSLNRPKPSSKPKPITPPSLMLIIDHRTLGAIERLRKHYSLPSKDSVVNVALELLNRHSRSDFAYFREGDEWHAVYIGNLIKEIK